jgi:protein-S-isoprenylcysteine O-methyltransferase Ste14
VRPCPTFLLPALAEASRKWSGSPTHNSCFRIRASSREDCIAAQGPRSKQPDHGLPKLASTKGPRRAWAISHRACRTGVHTCLVAEVLAGLAILGGLLGDDLVHYCVLLKSRSGAHRTPSAVLAGDLLVLLGLGMVFRVFQENSYTSAIVEVDQGQRVISLGPYRIVRHPMYTGSLFFLAGIPLALASLWGLLLWLPLAATIVWRLVDEERYLSVNLPGYAEYRTKTPFRLVPGIY